jgi:hypothetical protein
VSEECKIGIGKGAWNDILYIPTTVGAGGASKARNEEIKFC